MARHTFVAVVLPEAGALTERFTADGDEIWALRQDGGGGDEGGGLAYEVQVDVDAAVDADAAAGAGVSSGQFDCVDDDPACPPRCASWASGKRDHWL